MTGGMTMQTRTLAPRALPNSTSVINQTLALAHSDVRLKDMWAHPTEALEKADSATKLLVFENDFAAAKRSGMGYPRSWSEINRLLNTNYRPQDFNALGIKHGYISNMRDLKQAFKSVHAAYDDLNAPWVTRTCAGCGKEYSLSYWMVKWYTRRGLPLPKRCGGCIANEVGEPEEGA